MNFKGPKPKVIIGSGALITPAGKKLAAAYDWGTRTIKIGQAELKSIFEGSDTVPNDEEIAIFIASEEAAHYVQDMEGRLLHVDNTESIETPEHYASDYEGEAAQVSIYIANKLVPKLKFSRENIDSNVL